MKRISYRAISVLLIAVMILAGMGVFVSRYYTNAEKWALYFSSANSGATGTLRDRNGVILASTNGAVNTFSDDANLREACYHVTGDYWGRTGTGVLSIYRDNFTDYNLITGTTQSQPVNLTLSIDSELNRAAYNAMSGRNGAVMMLNYKTGEVLVMVSTPSTDPIDGNAVLLDGTFINKCISARFVPGSVFKLITAAAAIETIEPNSRTYYCDGEYNVSGVDIICSGTHYNQNFYQAMANSCNSAFAEIAIEVGHDNMVRYLRSYGFLDRHKLGEIPTVAGSYPTEFLGNPELGWSGIGQSTDLICPYTLLRFVSAIANDGVLVEPRLVLTADPITSSQLIEPSTAEMLGNMMENNVISHYEPSVNFPGLDLSAKTGTAELGDGTTHAWFTGFLNDPTHPYAFVVLVENGGGGLSTAGAVANQLLQAAVFR